MNPICYLCEKPISGEPIPLGARPYCADCYAKVTRDRRSLWWASLVEVSALILLVALVAFFANLIHPRLGRTGLILLGIFLALVPALLWLVFFYLQDVREPEPKRLVLSVFILGALLAQAVGIPLIDGVFRVSEWFPISTIVHILGAILVVGFTQQFLTYAAVRYSVYRAAEFDERIDGIVYAVAAALGYATVLNLRYVIQSGGVDPSIGMIRIAVTAMAMASFGGLVGYFLGRCKFEDEPLWWMPAGLILAAVLNGLFAYLYGEVTTTSIGLTGGGYTPWPGLALGTAVAVLTFAFLFYLIQRLQQRSPQAPGA